MTLEILHEWVFPILCVTAALALIAVGTFPDGKSALMLVCARLCHVAGTQWGCKKYRNMKHLEAALDDVSIAG